MGGFNGVESVLEVGDAGIVLIDGILAALDVVL